MDHHCPWIANCVGHHNYKYFFLFLFYMTTGCVFVTLVTLPAFIWETDTRASREKHEGAVFFVLILCATASFAVGGLNGLHLYLVLTNQTTIELYYNRTQSQAAKQRGEVFENPWDMGMRKNFQSLFGVGRHAWSWMLPGAPPGDGLWFEGRHHDDDGIGSVPLLVPT